MTFKEERVVQRWVRGILRGIIITPNSFDPRAHDFPIQVSGCVFCLQGGRLGGEVQVLSRMDPGTEHQSTGLLVIRPVGVIGVTLSVVDTREDTPDFSLC